MRKKILYYALVFGLVLTLSVPNLVNADNTQDSDSKLANEELGRNKKFRESMGLNSTPEAINAAVSQGNLSFGVYLTLEEEEDLNQRVSRQNRMPEIENSAKQKFGNNYAGMYIDQSKKGSIVIGLKNIHEASESYKSDLRSMVDDSSKMSFVGVRYSREELESITDKISKSQDYLKSKGVQSTH